MKFSEKWLREWVDPPVSTDQLIAQLTGAGLELESVEPVAPDICGLLVGEVLTVSPHPNADRLTVCTVSVGAEEPLTIVCGAANVRVGLKAPVAVIGARLADGSNMKRSKIRGQESAGMLCSTQEMGLAESAEGLMELPVDAPTGAFVSDYLALDDTSIEVDLTPNRGDCLSIAGIAREVGVLNSAPVSPPKIAEVPAVVGDEFPVDLESPADCPRYVGRVIRGIDPNKQTPIFMKEKLRRSGLRPISPVVDVTNYVLLELGQPMHAFDLATLADGIRVRRAVQGENLILLGGISVTLDSDTLVIADANRPVAMAGVMGGEETAVTDKTRDVFLESAFFTPRAIAGRARRYGLHTDSSHRFERGVDPALQRLAVERATALLLTIVGGEPGPIIEAQSPTDLPQPAPLQLRETRLAHLLGVSFSTDTIQDVLTRLGMAVTEEGADGQKIWHVTPPGFRFDISIEADLIEEIARVAGYGAIPARRPLLPLTIPKASDVKTPLARIRQVLVERDYREAITYSFVDPGMVSLLYPDADPLPLQNPISSEMAVMRPTLLPGLLQALIHNFRRQQSRIRLFESGLVFNRRDGELIQERVLGGIVMGAAFAEQWGAPAREVDFFDTKSDVEGLLSLTGRADECRFVQFSGADALALHPGQSALIERSGRSVGWIGSLHPRIVRSLKLPTNIRLFQINLVEIEAGALPEYAPLSRFPAVRRDIAVVVGKDIPSVALRDAIRLTASGVLKSINIFDEYLGEGIAADQKSMAFGLVFQDSARTLQDLEVDGLVTDIMTMLQDRFRAVARV